MQIREIRKADNEPLAKLIRDVFEEMDIPRAGTVYSDPTTDTLFESFKTGKSVLWVAEENGTLSGSCGIYPTAGLPEGHAELVKFYLSPNSRGKGTGKALFEKSIESAKEFGYTHLYIESFPAFKTAIQLYKKYGFYPIVRPLGNSGHTACNVWMLKDL